MILMLVIGYAFGIRSERRLCAEVHLRARPRVLMRGDYKDDLPGRIIIQNSKLALFALNDQHRILKFRQIPQQVL